MLGRIIKITIASNLQRRPSTFKEFFAWKKNKDFFIQICQAVWAISYSLLYVVSKINQGSCLGCLGGNDAPASIYIQRFLGLLLFTTMSLLLKQGILLSAFKDFWRGHKLCRFYLKQGTFLRLLSSAIGLIPLPPPLRRRRLWTAPNC